MHETVFAVFLRILIVVILLFHINLFFFKIKYLILFNQ